MNWAIGGLFTCTFPIVSPIIWYQSNRLRKQYRHAGMEYSFSLQVAFWTSAVLTMTTVAAVAWAFSLLVGEFGFAGSIAIIGGSFLLIMFLAGMFMSGTSFGFD